MRARLLRGLDVGRAAGARGLGDDPQTRNNQITLLREENTLGGGNGRKFQAP
jgi:hypothetical protein